MSQSEDLPHRNHLIDNQIYFRLFLLIKSVGLLLFVCFFWDLPSSFFKFKSHHEFFIASFELENTFDEIICFKDEGLLDSGYLDKNIASENRSHFNISLKLEIVSDLFVSNLGNFQESSYCKKVVHKHLLDY